MVTSIPHHMKRSRNRPRRQGGIGQTGTGSTRLEPEARMRLLEDLIANEIMERGDDAVADINRVTQAAAARLRSGE